MRTLDPRTFFVAGLLCGAANLCAQAPLSIRLDPDDEHKFSAYPERIIATDKDHLLMLGIDAKSPSASVGAMNIKFTYTLASYDAKTLAPLKTREVTELPGLGAGTLEDLFLHEGKAHALVAHLDQAAGKVVIAVCTVDHLTLDLGNALNVLTLGEGTTSWMIKGEVDDAIGLDIVPGAKPGTYIILSRSVKRSLAAGQMELKTSHAYAALVDATFTPLWSGTAEVPEEVSRHSQYMVTANDGVLLFFTRGGFKEETPSTLTTLWFDGKATRALEAKSVEGEGVGPYDVRAVQRADGKVVCAGTYGKERKGTTMMDRTSDGVYWGVLDPATGSWATFGTAPVLDKKGKQVYNLFIVDVFALPDNSVRILAQSDPMLAGGTSGRDLYMIGLDASGQVLFNERFSYSGGGYRANALVHDGRWFLVLNDDADNGALRAQGKEAKISYGVPCVVEVAEDGKTTEHYVTASSDPEQRLQSKVIWPLDKGRWATCGGLGKGYSYFGMGLIEAQ